MEQVEAVVEEEMKNVEPVDQYIGRGGIFNVVIAIDFTESNKKFDYHKINEDDKILNDYQQAIESVGKIMEQYAKDK